MKPSSITDYKKIDDVKKYPYFSHGPCLDRVFEEVTGPANFRILAFKRIYHNLDRIYIASHKDHLIDYFQNEFYKHSFFEKHPDHYQSSFHMWDHLPSDPHGIYNYLKVKFKLAHGLTVLQKHENYCDFFVFAATSDHISVNNYYLNLKESFLRCFQRFYLEMEEVIKEVDKHRLWMPNISGSNLIGSSPNIASLSKREIECGFLLLKGFTAKQMARQLSLSPRTVEVYLNNLKSKLNASNRTDLILKLNKL